MTDHNIYFKAKLVMACLTSFMEKSEKNTIRLIKTHVMIIYNVISTRTNILIVVSTIKNTAAEINQ